MQHRGTRFIDSRVQILDMAGGVEETLEPHAEKRLHQVTRHGPQPSSASVPIQRIPAGRHRTAGR